MPAKAKPRAKARSAGRPDKLTADVQEKICDAIRAGNYMAEAAEYGGIERTTFYRWLKRGETEAGRFRQFRNAVKKAERDSEAHAVAIIRKAMADDWRAAMTYLERRFPDRWGRRQRHEVSGPDGGAIAIAGGWDLGKLSDKELAALQALAEKAAADDG